MRKLRYAKRYDTTPAEKKPKRQYRPTLKKLALLKKEEQEMIEGHRKMMLDDSPNHPLIDY